jgi:polyhydroxybutyrate depolymerase
MKITLIIVVLFIFTKTNAQESTLQFISGTKTRTSLIYLPPTYNISKPSAVVLALHGAFESSAIMKTKTNFYAIADTANFIVLFPEGIQDLIAGKTWNSSAGSAGYYPNNTIDDVTFLNALLDTVIAKFNINTNQIFATGFSMGAFMCNKLVCNNTRIKAIATVAGTVGNGLTCVNTTAIPVLHFQATGDAVVAYTGCAYGTDCEAYVAKHVATNGCNTTPIVTNIADVFADGITATHYAYPNSTTKNDVEFYKITGGNHIWYGANTDANYSPIIWNFFNHHKNNFPTSINNAEPNSAIKHIAYYNLIGQKISENNLENGLYLKLIIFENGSTKTEKILR